jgi:hypothetical protein
MKISEDYLEQIKEPLIDGSRLTIVQYLKALGIAGKKHPDLVGAEASKFMVHFQHLVDSGCLKNTSNQISLDSFGVEFGTNDDLIIWSPSKLYYQEQVKSSDISSVVNNITITGGQVSGLQAGHANSQTTTKDKENKLISKFVIPLVVTVVGGLLIVYISTLVWPQP